MFTIIISIALILQRISAVCIEDFEVNCDQIGDYYELDTNNWQDLTIGDLETTGTISNDELIYLLQEITTLESLTIVNRVQEKFIFLDVPEVPVLRHLRLYGNNLETIWTRDYENFHNLVELNLKNNKISFINGQEWCENTIDIVDFSYNQIKEIEEKALLNYAIRKLDLSNNALKRLPPNGLNASLEILNLDFNKFTAIDAESLNNLVNLKELTLSHNGLTTIWNLDSHRQLQKIDFSFNEITRIQTNFKPFKRLKYQDFSYNRLRSLDFLSIIPENDLDRNISLAYNHLTYLEISDWNFQQKSPVTLTLFGNPWTCRCLDELNDFFRKNHFDESKCDLEIIGSGKVPHCIVQSFCNSSETNPNFIENFKQKLETNQKFIRCDIVKEMKKTVRKRVAIPKSGTTFAVKMIGNQTIFSDDK